METHVDVINDSTLTLVSRPELVAQIEGLEVISQISAGATGCYYYSLRNRTTKSTSAEDLYRYLACRKLFFNVTIPMSVEEQREIQNIIIHYCQRVLDIQCRLYITYDGNITSFYPLYQQESLWMTDSEISNIYVDWTPYIGMGYLGNTLLHVVASQELKWTSYFWINGLVLYPLSATVDRDQEDMQNIIFGIDNRAIALRRQGCTPFSSSEPVILEVCKEVAIAWQLVVRDIQFTSYTVNKNSLTPQSSHFLLIQDEHMNGYELGKWLDRTITSILIGDLPRTIISGDVADLATRYKELQKLNRHLLPFTIDHASNGLVNIPTFSLEEYQYLTMDTSQPIEPPTKLTTADLTVKIVVGEPGVAVQLPVDLPFAPSMIQIANIDEIDANDIPELEELFINLWMQNELTTPWGRYWYDKHGKISAAYANPSQWYPNSQAAISTLKLK